MNSRVVGEMQETKNYFWYTNNGNILGTGATSTVFMCRKKGTGEQHAVKVFKNDASNISKREKDMLEKLKECNHDNIVRIIAIEKLKTTISLSDVVIIMEYCEGSIYSMLENPENAYGFEEENFNQVVNDVVSGLKYLHDQGIVHRDIKPGNILCYLKHDGSPQYKLTDFGVARKLAPDQMYTTICGTAEYLHPDILRCHYFNITGNEFGAYADLWSLGVTFYHVATGMLPFQPFDRNDKKTMFDILTNKKSGIISGRQKTRDGSIEWSDQLPDKTRLSAGLKEHLVKLLRRLLERDEESRMTFEDLFEYMKVFIDMKIIPIYNARSGTFHKIYANPNDNFGRFQELIAIQTGISAKQQDLFHNSEEFKLVNSMATVSSFSDYMKEKPMIVLGEDSQPPETNYSHVLLKEMRFTPNISMDSDYLLFKIATKQIHWCLYVARELESSRKLTTEAVESVVALLKRKAQRYLNYAQTIENLCNTMVTKHVTCLNGCEFEMNILQTLSDDGDIPEIIMEEKKCLEKETQNMREKVKKLQEGMSEPLEKLRNKAHKIIPLNGELEELWKNMCRENNNNENYIGVVENSCYKITEIMRNVTARKHSKDNLPNAEIQNQSFDRLRLNEYILKAKTALEGSEERMGRLQNNLRTWLLEGYKHRHHLKKLRQEVSSYVGMFEAVIKSEEQWRTDHMDKMKNILKEVRSQVRKAITISDDKLRDGQERCTNCVKYNTEDIDKRITTVVNETKQSTARLNDNTQKFRRLVEEVMKDFDQRNKMKVQDINLE